MDENGNTPRGERQERLDVSLLRATPTLMRLAAGHVDALAQRLMSMGAQRLSLVGGLSLHIERWLAPATRLHLSPPAGDALEGALQLARAAAESTVA